MIVKQFIGFSLSGGVGTAAHYGLLYILVEFARLDPSFSSFFGFIAGATVNYGLARNIVFKSQTPILSSMVKFFISAAIGAALNTAIFFWVLSTSSVHYFVAQFIATAFVLVWNYILNSRWIFHDGK